MGMSWVSNMFLLIVIVDMEPVDLIVFKGPLGPSLRTEIHKIKVVQFQPVATPLADIDEEVQKGLSRDQLLLYQYTKATSTETITKKLEAQSAGSLNHTRWLTLAIRIQQLSTRTPTTTEDHQMVHHGC